MESHVPRTRDRQRREPGARHLNGLGAEILVPRRSRSGDQGGWEQKGQERGEAETEWFSGQKEGNLQRSIDQLVKDIRPRWEQCEGHWKVMEWRSWGDPRRAAHLRSRAKKYPRGTHHETH